MISAAPLSIEDILTEKMAFAELISWAKDRPKWQQDALRRLVLNDVLTEEDIDDLVGVCLDAKAPSVSITSAHVAAEGASGEPIALLRIENPTGINALAADQKLEFAKDGLTVIYGDNGSGTQAVDRRTHDRLAQPLPPSRQGLGKSQPQCPRVLETCVHPPHAAKALQPLMKF